MISDLLDFSKLESGQLTVKKALFEVDALLMTTVRMFEKRAMEKHLEVVVTCEDAASRLSLSARCFVCRLLLFLFSTQSDWRKLVTT